MIEAWQELRRRLFGILQKIEPVACKEKLKRWIPPLRSLSGSFRYVMVCQEEAVLIVHRPRANDHQKGILV
ncbi:hypothetical protein [Nostoc commune]|uniref:hypothetical protein n=1 Tax=Nostoc commune TaxID=1178 RepID=UPI0018C51D53|nr:hypothetical protein [Nostoc commune]MBG1260688.1 hypothetical protein [Nostoc commune BAE]